MPSILQPWVEKLGLRHQGVLLGAVRGPDGVSRECPAKALVRSYRAAVLVCHCGDPAKAKSYIEEVGYDELIARMSAVAKSHDDLPHHFLLHLVHAAEIVGYKGPRPGLVSVAWGWFYQKMCHKFHVTAETEAELDLRLNADEETFGAKQ